MERVSVCGCGKDLYPFLDAAGDRIGVTHTLEDEEHHSAYFAGIDVQLRYISEN
jgi:hypothetical protein